MPFTDSFLKILPEIKGPTEKRLSFNHKLKWTLAILVAFFVLGEIPLYGLGQNALSRFEFLSIILAAKFGSIISLGIGPIVTASIVLQLLVGSGMLKLDTTKPEDRKFFQGLQKILVIFFIIFESMIYVFMGGLSPSPTLPSSTFTFIQFILIFQLFIGGMLILYMDEVVNKWGFGSGVSLFIAAGVSAEIIVKALSPLSQAGKLALGTNEAPVGKIWVLFRSLTKGVIKNVAKALASILSTILVFLLAVYTQSMKVEIPLSFGRIRGHGIRWPLNFFYTSNIPVILTAALMANMQLWGRLLQNLVGDKTSGILYFLSKNIMGQYSGDIPSSGLIAWLYSPDIIGKIIDGVINSWSAFLNIFSHSLIYMLFMMIGSVIFSVFWMQTAGMDAKSQAKHIMASGLQIPGFRRDPRILEQILKRYILPLTIMGGATVGILAASADLMDALSRGTGILLTVMIIHRLYEEIAKKHMMDMHPALKKIISEE